MDVRWGVFCFLTGVKLYGTYASLRLVVSSTDSPLESPLSSSSFHSPAACRAARRPPHAGGDHGHVAGRQPLSRRRGDTPRSDSSGQYQHERRRVDGGRLGCRHDSFRRGALRHTSDDWSRRRAGDYRGTHDRRHFAGRERDDRRQQHLAHPQHHRHHRWFYACRTHAHRRPNDRRQYHLRYHVQRRCRSFAHDWHPHHRPKHHQR